MRFCNNINDSWVKSNCSLTVVTEGKAMHKLLLFFYVIVLFIPYVSFPHSKKCKKIYERD